ncbi:glycosyltransferase family 2 protein [uncultured Devosia sp.]|uniref:glycosyltransferase family 2 protein n=1 Tax=uncultured Devosia sp. TaxID=211434 RepID=UPI0035CC3345
MAPLFSVVIPVKNRTRLLARALASLAGQTCSDFEVLVVDDGSSEDVAAVTARFPGLDITLLAAGGTGASSARNIGTDVARGEYIAYLDSDDVFIPEKLAIVAAELAKTPADVIASPLYVWRNQPHVQIRPARPPLPNEDIADFFFVADQRIQSTGMIVRASAARKVRWDEGLSKVQDPDFLIRLLRAGSTLHFIPTPLAVLYDDTAEGRVSSNNSEANMRDWLQRDAARLSRQARIGFELYALAYEVARTSKLKALALVGKGALSGMIAPTIIAKSMIRILLPEARFKALAQTALRRKPEAHNAPLAAYLNELETTATCSLQG